MSLADWLIAIGSPLFVLGMIAIYWGAYQDKRRDRKRLYSENGFKKKKAVTRGKK